VTVPTPSRLTYAAPGWGVGELWLDADLLVGHELPRVGVEEAGGGELAKRFASYFGGEVEAFDDVELDLDGSAFQRALADALRSVPYGETVTYGELAALAGSPNAARAAGTFCAGNRFPLVVPCHRVIAADGIGGFGSLGVDYKRRLLELERARLPERVSGCPGLYSRERSMVNSGDGISRWASIRTSASGSSSRITAASSSARSSVIAPIVR
jgi:O-6-methylguanine DNA methyltransferase